MIREYRGRHVFHVTTIRADKVFKYSKFKLEDKLYPVTLTMCDADKHSEVIESMIRFVKEQIQVVHL